MGAVLLAGLANDLRGVGRTTLLAVLAAAAFGLCAQGGTLRAVALPWVGTVELGALAWPLAVLWLIGFAHAYDAIDAVDGLAAAIGFVSAAAIAMAALANGSLDAPAAAALAGALAGFLRFNRAPASIVLGDAGSLPVGFAVGALALGAAGGEAGEASPAASALALALPVMALSAGWWRLRRARPPVPAASEAGTAAASRS
jgi:UDP-GlcNAc:undecaprenyl-phosphate GlcNAc-1-phosphate transferase